MDERTILVQKGSFSSFVRGALIGAAIALLFAPRTGVETREILTEKSTEFRDKATEIARDTRYRAETAIGDARNKLNDTVRGVKQGVSSGSSEAMKDLKRENEILEDVNNPIYPL